MDPRLKIGAAHRKWRKTASIEAKKNASKRHGVRIGALFFALMLLLGCGGGGPPQAEWASHEYPRAVYQPPNYHPYASRSHAYFWVDTVYLGGDMAPREELREVQTFNGITYSMGASRDGVGRDRLLNYGWDLATMELPRFRGQLMAVAPNPEVGDSHQLSTKAG